MANILGELLISLGLNSVSFTEGLNKASYAARAGAKDIQGSLGDMGEEVSRVFDLFEGFGDSVNRSLGSLVTSMGNLVRSVESLSIAGELSAGAMAAMGGAAIGVAAAVGETSLSMMNLAQGFENTSAKTGLSLRDTQLWTAAAQSAGLSGDELASSLGRVQLQLGRYIETGGRVAANTGTFVTTMKDLGVAIQNPDKSFRSLNDILVDFSDKLNKIPDLEQRNAVAVSAMGRGGQAFVQIVNQANIEGESLGEMLAGLGQSWIIMSDQQIKSLAVSKANWDDFTRSLIGDFRVLGEGIADFGTSKLPKAPELEGGRGESLGASKAAASLQAQFNVVELTKNQNDLLLEQAGIIEAGGKAQYELKQAQTQYNQLLREGVGSHGAEALELAKKIALYKEQVKLAEFAQRAVKAPTDEVAKSLSVLEQEVAAQQRFAGALGSTTAEIDRNKATAEGETEVARLRSDLLSRQAELEGTLSDAKSKSSAEAKEIATSTQRELDFVKQEIVELDAASGEWDRLAEVKAQTSSNNALYASLVSETDKIREQTAATRDMINAKTADATISARIASEMAAERDKAAAGGNRSDVTGALDSKASALRGQIATEQEKISSDLADATAAQVAGINLETDAVMKGTAARRDAAAQAEALKYAEAHPEATAEQLAQEAAGVKSVADAKYQQSVAEKAATLDARTAYETEISLLNDVKEKYSENADIQLAVAAAERDAQEKMQHDLDMTEEKVGTLKQGLSGLLNELILGGQNTQQGVLASLKTGIDGAESSLAKFIVTGRGGFLSVLREMEEALIKLGIQFLVAKAMQAIFGSASTASQSASIVKAQIGRQAAIGEAAAEAAASAAWGGPGAAIAAAATTEAALQGITALEKGGEMVPGHAYLVGERHPEVLFAGAAGHVFPSVGEASKALGSGGAQGPGETHIHVTHSVSAMDASSFKGFLSEHSEILAGAVRDVLRDMNAI